jgi:hypothetical protein
MNPSPDITPNVSVDGRDLRTPWEILGAKEWQKFQLFRVLERRHEAVINEMAIRFTPSVIRHEVVMAQINHRLSMTTQEFEDALLQKDLQKFIASQRTPHGNE